MKKLGFILAASALALAACGSGEESGSEGTGGEASKDIKLGATAGPYSDMLSKAIVPGLEEKGYTVELVEFSVRVLCIV